MSNLLNWPHWVIDLVEENDHDYRISAHLLGLGTHALDMGAMTVFFYTFREREKIYDLSDELCGARVKTVFMRVGGISRDLKKETAARIRTVPSVAAGTEPSTGAWM